MASYGSRSDSAQQYVLLARTGGTGPSVCSSRLGWRFYVANAKDDNHAGHGLETGIDKSYDALDDAAYVRILHDAIS